MQIVQFLKNNVQKKILIDWFIDWFIDSLIDSFTDSLIDWSFMMCDRIMIWWYSVSRLQISGYLPTTQKTRTKRNPISVFVTPDFFYVKASKDPLVINL